MKIIQVDQILLFVAIGKHLTKKHGKGLAIESRHYNAMIAAADRIVEEFGRESVYATPGMGFEAWAKCDDTGESSLYMADILLRGRSSRDVREPQDSADFGRCVRFLDAVPEARLNLVTMNDTPYWGKLIDHWDELEALYREAKGKSLYDRMKELQAEVTAAEAALTDGRNPMSTDTPTAPADPRQANRIQIKSRFDDRLLFECEAETMLVALQMAVAAKA